MAFVIYTVFMKVKEFIQHYASDAIVQTIASDLADISHPTQLKGLVGSADAIFVAAIQHIKPSSHVFILEDKDDAHYFLNDLQNLVDDAEVLMFPASYKKAYQFEETDNANILQRAEVLNKLNSPGEKPMLIVTYPEALFEKVINKRSLLQNTFGVKVGDKLDTSFLAEIMHSYDFEKSDFVYEPGQFSIRGGIVDIFSYANELPYRIELFGDEIESIRTFAPDTQLSVENKKFVSIIPNVQTRLLQESREPFTNFLSADCKVWHKDYGYLLEIVDKYYQKAESEFAHILEVNNGSSLVNKPSDLFETSKSFETSLKKFKQIEFGKRFKFKGNSYAFDIKAQESFNKDFTLIANRLASNTDGGITNLLFAESMNQLTRLEAIFGEINPNLQLAQINVALREGFTDKQMKLACFTDHQLFDRFHRYKDKEKHTKSKALTLKELKTLQPGDYVVHADYGVGRFAGMEKVDVGAKQQEAIRLVFRDDDLLYVSIHSLHKISKYSGKEGETVAMSKLGSQEWENKKKSAKKKVKDIAKELIALYAKRKAAPGFSFSPDSFLQAELETSFIYEDTPDQAKATNDVKADMEKAHPMDRLVCGDVGFGKTEIAIRAAFKAVCDSKQVVVLVPTTVLAMQHFRTFKARLEKLPCRVEYVNRFKTAAQIRETLKRVEEGKTDILIGTHRAISKDVVFKNLGLLIIDEEQKFGVATKEKLKNIKINVDTLTLTATPIPRTLHFSLMGARDLSIIATPPPNRQPVTTEIHAFTKEILRDAVSAELKRGGQVFMVHNRINDLDGLGDIIFKMVPDARIGVAHGQMDGDKLEQAMMKFIEGEYDVLISTNIIESGLDIPNANTIIINNAHMFGLSDLHQMRGRVGRSNKKAFCYLLTPPVTGMTSDARKRLGTLEEFSDLGDGFKVAMRDLDIRGAGNLLGGEQSGFITDLGFEMYHNILDEAIQELKETDFKELFEGELKIKPLVRDCIIETDLSILIPDAYVANITERLSLYSELDSIKEEESLLKFEVSLKDRFGPLPIEVHDLLETVRLRWRAVQLGFEKLSIKAGTMRCYVNSEINEEYFKSEVFGKILAYVQKHPKKCRLKDTKDKLMIGIDDVHGVAQAMDLFDGILA